MSAYVQVFSEANDMAKFFKRQAINAALLKEMRAALGINGPTLQNEALTRFCSRYMVLDALIRNKEAIAKACVSDNFQMGSTKKDKERAKAVQKRAVDAEWWESVQKSRELLEPLMIAVKLVQGDDFMQSDAYWMMVDLEAKFEELAAKHEEAGNKEMAQLASTMKTCVEKRNDYGYHPVQGLAALLDPKYRQRIGEIPRTKRVNAEYWAEVLTCANPVASKSGNLDRPWETDVAARMVCVELSAYCEEPAKLGMEQRMFDSPKIKMPSTWWQEYGFRCERGLQDVALRVLNIPASSAAGERVFSALGHIWSPKRSAMLMGRAAALTFVYFNARVIDRVNAVPSADDWDDIIQWMHDRSIDEEMEGAMMVDLAATEGQEGTEDSEDEASSQNGSNSARSDED